MPKLNQYLTVKAQVESFKELGFICQFDIQDYKHKFAPKIRLIGECKMYRFSDENWDIVSSQLAKLYGVIKNEKRAA